MMNIKSSLILYGAFDRYNYGDNLMPILLEQFFLKKDPCLIERYDIVYASIQQSDLSRYGCLPTVPIKNLLGVADGSVLIVAGGETMGASVGGLYLHTFENKMQHRLAKIAMRYTRRLYTLFAILRYPSPWFFPYIPNKSSFSNEVSIVLNTVGGIPPAKAIKSLKKIDYIAVRDIRSFQVSQAVFEAQLVPDSVLLLSKLFSIQDLELKTSSKIKSIVGSSGKYIVIQMCPYKASTSPEYFAQILLDIKHTTGVEVILLPIGYASGHDDLDYLTQVYAHAKNETHLLYGLTVWEIAYVIAKSIGFYGTSLHGVITALAYEVPHYCINGRLDKLTSFLDTWSIEPFKAPMTVDQIKSSIDCQYDRGGLRQKVNAAQNKIEAHYDLIFKKFLCHPLKNEN